MKSKHFVLVLNKQRRRECDGNDGIYIPRSERGIPPSVMNSALPAGTIATNKKEMEYLKKKYRA